MTFVRDSHIRTQGVIRYVVTHVGRDGTRTLAHACQGRNTWATREEAQDVLNSMTRNNSVETLRQLFGLPLEVRPCECWPVHFDPMGIYFEESQS